MQVFTNKHRIGFLDDANDDMLQVGQYSNNNYNRPILLSTFLMQHTRKQEKKINCQLYLQTFLMPYQPLTTTFYHVAHLNNICTCLEVVINLIFKLTKHDLFDWFVSLVLLLLKILRFCKLQLCVFEDFDIRCYEKRLEKISYFVFHKEYEIRFKMGYG